MGARIRRWRWGGAIALLLALGIAYSFWPERVPVDIARVDRGEMAIGVTDDGVTRVRDLFTVSAPVSGYVTRIELDPGDRVVAGSTVIARMAPLPSPPLDTRTRAELESALRASQAGEAAAQAALTLARSDLERAEALAQRGFLSRARLEESRAARQSRAADLERARAESRRLQAAMSDPRDSAPRGGAVAVRSPESGVLLRRLTQSEGAIAMGTPLVEIGDPARIEVVLDLLSREAARVRTGNEVLITHWGGEETLRGRVSRVEPSGRLKVSALGIEEQRVDVIVGFDPVPAARLSALGHGYQVDGTVVLWRDRNALRVPVGALFRAPAGAWQVFVVEAGRARLRNVAIGRINEEYGQVLRGLKQGDEAILNPGSRIADGTRIARR